MTLSAQRGACIRWRFAVETGSEGIVVSKTSGITGSSSGGMSTGNYWMQVDDFVADYEAALNVAAGSAGGPPAAFAVGLDHRGRLTIENTDGDDYRLVLSSVGWTLPLQLLGEDDAVDVDIAAGETYTAPWTAQYQWVPAIFDNRFAIPQKRKLVTSSKTLTERCESVQRSDPWYIQTIRWDVVAASRIHRQAALDAQQSESGGVTQGDENAHIEHFIEVAETNTPVRVAEWPGEASPSTTEWQVVQGSFWADDKSGVGEGDLVQESALESYKVEIKLRTDSI